MYFVFSNLPYNLVSNLKKETCPPPTTWAMGNASFVVSINFLVLEICDPPHPPTRVKNWKLTWCLEKNAISSSIKCRSSFSLRSESIEGGQVGGGYDVKI